MRDVGEHGQVVRVDKYDVELGHHKRYWPELRVEIYLVLVPLHVANHVELVLSKVLDGALLLLRDLVKLGRELELSVAELELVLPAEA